jgi:post-segregation antitoxin (ccd killing protein)
MARVQLYLPDDLHAEAKAKGLLLSNLLQGAVRAALREERLGTEMDRYLTELRDEVGEPSKLAKKRAAAWAERVLSGPRRSGARRPRRAA